jgi:hypothetical protein
MAEGHYDTPSGIPPEHLAALGCALLLTSDVGKDSDRQQLWRQGWQEVWKTSHGIVSGSLRGRKANRFESPDLECAFRVIDHALRWTTVK